jgi:hypothetical protein
MVDSSDGKMCVGELWYEIFILLEQMTHVVVT